MIPIVAVPIEGTPNYYIMMGRVLIGSAVACFDSDSGMFTVYADSTEHGGDVVSASASGIDRTRTISEAIRQLIEQTATRIPEDGDIQTGLTLTIGARS